MGLSQVKSIAKLTPRVRSNEVARASTGQRSHMLGHGGGSSKMSELNLDPKQTAIVVIDLQCCCTRAPTAATAIRFCLR